VEDFTMHETKLFRVLDSGAGLHFAEHDPRTKTDKPIEGWDQQQTAALSAAFVQYLGVHLHVGDIVEVTARIIKRDGTAGCDTCDKLMEPAAEEKPEPEPT
jgi:hypothetical protein